MVPAPRPHALCRGFALPAVLVLALVLGSVLFMLNRSVTHYRRRSTRFRDGEVAYYAARSGLALLERRLEQLASRPTRATGSLGELASLLLESRPEDLDEAEDELPLPFASRLLPEGTDGQVEARIRFRRVGPLQTRAPAGFALDPLEKRGILELECLARVGLAERRLLVRRDFQVLQGLPPVIGRFALLLGENGGHPEASNALTYSPRLGLYQRSVSRQVGWPLQVYPLPVLPEDEPRPGVRFADDPLEPLRSGGWVGLLGEQPWVLNLSFGPGAGSPSEQGYLVRNFPWISESTRFPGLEEKHLRFGFARDILQLPMFAAYEAENLPDGSSLLQLAGDSRHRLPPVVLGRAFRRFLTFTKLRSDSLPRFVSLHGVGEESFDEVAPTFQELVPGGDHTSYRQVMGRSVVEPYNRSYDFVVTDRELRDEAGRVDPDGSPWQPERHLLASRIAPFLAPRAASGEAFLYPDPARSGEERAGAGVQIGTEEGEPLFEGVPEDLLPGLAEWLPARCSQVLGPDAEAGTRFREAFLVGERLRLGASVLVDVPELSLGPLHVEEGGTLVVRGKLELRGPITTGRGQLLSLVSLEGDIQLRNEQPVAAALVACRGQVLPSTRGMDVRGQVVAARFDSTRWLEGSGARRIVYDPRLNPALVVNRRAQNRIVLGRERRVVYRRQ